MSLTSLNPSMISFLDIGEAASETDMEMQMVAQLKSMRVFVVIVTYNPGQLIDHCLDSLVRSIHPVHTIVVDNASTDNTLQTLVRYPEVCCIPLPHNVGFGRANNIGISQALTSGADYVFLLNQDAEISDDTIAKLLLIAQSHPQIGIVSPVHLNGDGSAIDPEFLQLMASRTPSFVSDLFGGRRPSVYLVDFVNAAAWLCSRRCLLDVGGFDPLYFMYGEDDDLCNRVRFHGYRIGIAPHAIIRHSRIHSEPKLQGRWQQGRANFRRLSEQVKTINMIALKNPFLPFHSRLGQIMMQTMTDLTIALVHFAWRRVVVIVWGNLKTIVILTATRRHRQKCLRIGPHWLDIELQT